MLEFTFFVTEQGKLPQGIRETLARVIPTFAGKKCRLSISEAKDKRSLESNRYYWGCVVSTIRQYRLEQGDAVSLEQVHEDLLSAFAPLVEREILGVKRIVPMRSSAMNKDNFTQYLRNIEVALADFGISLPAHEKYE